jgi:tetratricopeptide (TPR) repeat protein
MASIVPGYEYDIFISYRQKDNKGDRWVSTFVESLKTELESTFKEAISVYLDINPHDGLLETHDVDASLNEKLKCLVFIPVISRTYCDPKSFAWEHEFKAFVDRASRDPFGLKIKLPDGNVANRVLPVRIHDLDQEDIQLCESILGGVLRGVEFIYKEPGVNRSLTRKDDERKNLNNTLYRNQINKVALAAKEIIQAMKTSPAVPGKERAQPLPQTDIADKEVNQRRKENPLLFINRKLLLGIGIAAVLFIAAVFAWPLLFNRNTLNKLRSAGERISVAVMPFRNITNDSTLNIWQDGVQFNLITSLSNSPELKVRQTEPTNNLLQSKGLTNYARITPSVAKNISRNLEANIFIYGTINEADRKIRISAQLIDSKTEEVFRSFQLNGEISKVLVLTDSLSAMIKNFLIISDLRKEVTSEFQTVLPNSVEAYKSFILGYKAFLRGDNLSAISLFSEAIKIDSGFIYCYVWLSLSYANEGLYDQAKKFSLKAYEKKEKLPLDQRIWTNWLYSRYVEKSADDEMKYAKQLLELGNDDRVPLSHFVVGSAYYELEQYSNAIPELTKALEIYKEWNTKPPNSYFYEVPIIAYHKTGMFKKERELLKKAIEYFPDDPQIIRRQAILSLSERDTIAAGRYIEKWKTIRRENSWTEGEIEDGLASIYNEARNNKKAEEYYRKAYSLETQKPERMYSLGYFLIDDGSNLEEGLGLVENALKSDPRNWAYIGTKGWVLYKQGKYNESLRLLEKSDSLKPVYNLKLDLLLREVKKAINAK